MLVLAAGEQLGKQDGKGPHGDEDSTLSVRLSGGDDTQEFVPPASPLRRPFWLLPVVLASLVMDVP